ncbi:head GIN domain-containing protein [Sphingomonas sp. CFBP8993]|uniref:head GIN domain-containing protein n=1 Tax=Sphingomonas sp. CFBP8993 TaxID=3096526 RepID=UPI002A6A6E2F|nr:head GIN domain-containing protein [Sphingomonas sp. CFBP8993]MDY0959245.1 head GIN domain-containing protein [Sphingomonas sp. CFBP8993]
MIRSLRLPLIAVAVLAIPTAACSFDWSSDEGDVVPAQGSGNARSFAARDFTGVDLHGSDPVEVRVGGDYSVRAEGPADTLDQLQVERNGTTLRIGRKKGVHWGWSKGNPVRILVTLPHLADAGVSGSGRMTVDRVEGPRFHGGIAGSGDLVIGAMRVGHADLGVAGSGSISASGTADTLKIGVAGSGDVRATGLRTRQADVSIAGSGNVTARVEGPAKVNLMGSGSADLGPQSTCTVNKMGSGSARCGR